ncbi:hypothetical protein CH262_12535 [Rhodococcus sp. 05-2255-1e]|uniref:hypothetical protein n=1 Tax=Rhodococcus sp. 05-2255-1e TaxID=2022495 RepID=UPI000B9AE2ED|nr:hypothetical protein [Rhodococcus sp. 05-2255-1e]OZE25677.1 hypothetical protein CH262_12535 [Rhodococcus sp. 05-2255-1e]
MSWLEVKGFSSIKKKEVIILKNWLQTKTHLLVDTQDLILLQHCIKLSEESEWFRIDSSDVAKLLGVGPKRIANRKKRLVRDGVLEREMRFDEKQHYFWFRLAGVEE